MHAERDLQQRHVHRHHRASRRDDLHDVRQSVSTRRNVLRRRLQRHYARARRNGLFHADRAAMSSDESLSGRDVRAAQRHERHRVRQHFGPVQNRRHLQQRRVRRDHESAERHQCVAQNTAACDRARLCSGGVCQPATALPNGTTCRAAQNACQTAATCSGGTCPANRRARTTSSSRRRSVVVAGRSPTSPPPAIAVCADTLQRRFVRGAIGNGTHYFCTCSSNAQCSPLTTCRTFTPNSFVCSCNSDGECPGNANCVNVSGNPNYCN